MKLGKAYRIFMLIFCGGYLAGLLLLLIFAIFARFSSSDAVQYMYLILLTLYAGWDPEATGLYVRCCTPILPAAVAVVYFLCRSELREAKEKGELLPILIPAGIGLLGLVIPGAALINMVLMPILYIWTVGIQIAGLVT